MVAPRFAGVRPNPDGPLGEPGTYLWIGLIFGVVNAIVGPVLRLLSLPFVLGKWKLSVPVTVVLACLSSAGIEYLQYRYSLGRCEVDDVIMNTLGALLGCSARWISHSWKRK